MEDSPPAKSRGREIVERTVEAALGSVPLAGPALAVTFVTALGWRLEERREEWFTHLAEAVEDLRQRADNPNFDDPRFTDAVVSATRTVEHTHQTEKLTALRNAVLNSALPGAPDADTQATLLGLVDRLTPSHLRFLTMWDDPPAWFESRGLTPPQALMAASRTQTVEAGLPEMAGKKEFYLRVTSDLYSAELMSGGVMGMVSASSLMDRLTTNFGRQLVLLISPPRL